jgi:flagellar biosynthesis/type III secretory pathway protein FliH
MIEAAIEAEAAAEAIGPEKDNLGKMLEEADVTAAVPSVVETAPALATASPPVPEPTKKLTKLPKPAPLKKGEVPETVDQAREMAATMQAEMITKTEQIEKEAAERNAKAAALSSSSSGTDPAQELQSLMNT